MDTDSPPQHTPPLKPRDRVVRRLVKHGVPKEYLDRFYPGIVAFAMENKSSIPELVSSILPTYEEVAESINAKDGVEKTSMKLTMKNRFRECMTWLQWLMFESDPADTLKNLAIVNVGQCGVCGTVWGNKNIAYRCCTCEYHPTCVICVPCLENGDHKDHDYSSFYNGGGCCDCGDVTAWKREGFCSKHKGTEQIQPLEEKLANSAGPVLDALFKCWKNKLSAAEIILRGDLLVTSGRLLECRKYANEVTYAIVEMLLYFCKLSDSLLSFISMNVISSAGLLEYLVSSESYLSKNVMKKLHELLLKLLVEPSFKYEFAKEFLKYYPTMVNEAITYLISVFIEAFHFEVELNHVEKTFTNHRQSASLLQLVVKHYTSSATLPVVASSTRKEPSFAESYLVDTLGFSPQSALTASRYVRFKTADKPESVLSCFREYGLSETQLSLLVRRCPRLLSCNTEKKLSPKLEFFLSKGVSRTELARLLSTNPFILTISLENHMVPFYDFYRSFLKSDENVSRMIVRCPCFINYFGCYTKANIDHLRHNSVPESKIATLVRNWPTSLAANIKRFNEIVGFVKEKGLNPSNRSFVTAIAVVAQMSTPTWEKKVRLYESWGWSIEDVIGAFKKSPLCLATSESKINAVMDLLINDVGCETVYIAQHPIILLFSLEQRIIPRCSVIKVLVSKGMIKLTSLSSMLKISDDLFEKKLLTKYKEEALDLLKLYREKMNVPK